MAKTIKIFLADDNELIRLNAKARWAELGVTATCFANGNELLEALRAANEMPLAVLADYEMEGGKAELVKKLNKEFPDVPVIVYTGRSHDKSVQTYTLGAYAVMQKPLDYKELHDILKELDGQDKVYRQLAKDARTLTGMDTCIVWQYDKPLKSFKIVGWHGELDRETVRKSLMDEEKFPRVASMKSDGKALYYKEVLKAPIYRQKALAMKWKWTSLLALPLQRNDKVIGWMDCYACGKPHAFDDIDQWKEKLPYLKEYVRQSAEVLHSTVIGQHFRILHETNQILAGTFDYAIIYDTILKKAKEVTGADCGWVYEYDSAMKNLKFGDSFGLKKGILSKTRALKDGGITGKVAHSGETLYVPDIQQPSIGYTPSLFIPVEGVATRSVLSVPMRKRERTLGVITLHSTEPDFFTQADSQLIMALASVGAISIERTKLTQHLSKISELAQDADADFDDLADYVVNAVRDLTDADVNLWMISKRENEGNDWLRILKSSKSSDHNPDYQTYIRESRVPTAPGASLIAKALHNKRFEIVNDMDEHDPDRPPFYNEAAVKMFHWRSFMTVPLIGKNEEFLGAISLFSTFVNKFTEEEGLLIQHFANQAALALQEQRHIEVLGELTNVGQELTVEVTAAQKLSKKVAELAQKISKADFTVVYPFDSEKDSQYNRDLSAHYGTFRGPKEISERPRKDGMAAYIIQRGMLVIENFDRDKHTIKMRAEAGSHFLTTDHPDYQKILDFVEESSIIRRENIRAFVGIALKAVDKESPTSKTSKQQDIAVLYFNYRAPHHFTEGDLQVLNIFANQVANIIYRNLLYARVIRQRTVLEGLSNSAVHIMNAQHDEKAFEKIVEEAAKLLHAKGGKIYLINDAHQQLRLAAVKGIDRKVMKPGQLLPKDKGMANVVVQKKVPLIIDDYKTYEHSVPEYREHFSTVVEVPLMRGEEVIGVLGVFDNNAQRRFTQDDQRVLERLAKQAALVIHHNTLYKELEALYNTSSQIVAQASMHDMAETILKEMRSIIDYDRATLQRIENEDAKREILAKNGFEKYTIDEDLLGPIKASKLLYHRCYQKQDILIISDTEQEPLWKPRAVTKDIKSWVCIPLVYNEQVLGVITLDHTLKGFYQNRDKERLARFARFAAIALNNTVVDQQHMTELQKFANWLNQLRTEKDGADDVYEKSVEIIEQVFKPEKYVFHYIDEVYFKERRKLLKKFPRHFHTQHLSQQEQADTLGHKSIAFLVAQEGDAKLFPDEFDLQLFPNSDVDKKHKLTFAPVWRQGKIVGVLEIESKASEQDENRKSFLSTIILQAALAIEKLEQQERKAQAIKEAHNPYIVGEPIRNANHFYGRNKLLNDILNGVHNNNYALLDERRIGKTSLLLRLEYEMLYGKPREYRNHDLRPAFFTLEGVPPQAFFYTLMSNILHAVEFLDLGVKEPVLEGYGNQQFMRDMMAVKKAIKAKTELVRKQTIVLLIDELDTLNTYPDSIQSQFRAIMTGKDDLLKVVMVGYEIKEKPPTPVSQWYNFLRIFKNALGPLTEADAIELITQPANGYYLFHHETIRFILEKSECKPLHIQHYCSEALSNMFVRYNAEKTLNSMPIILLEDVEHVAPPQLTFTR